ncbi:hypothetical protein EV401DRAFT_2192003 [Pisolithus croceorrhizus]|nr:hypothetical protein EV401DRAFT_2192003 [Pisolithus croceorrhizus]
MVKEAALFAMVRILGMSGGSEWLAPPQRTTIWGIVNRHLRDTENALSELEMSIRVVPLETDRLTGMSAAAATTISLATQVFPSIRGMLGNDGEYKRCGKLWTAVLERPRIAAYWKENKIEARPWSITEYGTAEWIARAAASFDHPQQKLYSLSVGGLEWCCARDSERRSAGGSDEEGFPPVDWSHPLPLPSPVSNTLGDGTCQPTLALPPPLACLPINLPTTLPLACPACQ